MKSADVDEDEERFCALRKEAQEKLQEAREKLDQAREDLEATIADLSGPRHNPFGRKNANLKQLATELKATPPPVLGDSRTEPQEEDG